LLQEVLLPRLGQTVEQATIENWLVSEGDVVKKGDVLLEITTDKATLEVESFVNGTVLKVYPKVGDEVAVESVIAYVGDPDKDEAPAEPPQTAPSAPSAAPAPAPAAAPTGASPAAAPAAVATASPVAVAPAATAVATAPARPARLFISPRAKKLAEREQVTPLAIAGSGPEGRIVEADVAAYAGKVTPLRTSPTARAVAYERGVDLLTVKATGVDGRIMKADVERARPLGGVTGRRVELTPARRIIAERMTRSKREAPHFYLLMDIDMTEVVAMRTEMKNAGSKVSFNDIIIKAIALGFEAVPMMNAGWGGDCVVVNENVDVALAVALEEGLMVPVVRGVEHLDLEGVSEQTVELIGKARSKRLTPDDYEGGSITISNLGMYDVTNFLPIINPGQASILGVGRIAEKAVVIDGGIGIRKLMAVTLAADHRVVDGATAAAFLKAVKDALENPRTSLA